MPHIFLISRLVIVNFKQIYPEPNLKKIAAPLDPRHSTRYSACPGFKPWNWNLWNSLSHMKHQHVSLKQRQSNPTHDGVIYQASYCGSDWPDGHTSHYESYHSEGSMATGDLRNGYHLSDILASGPGDMCPPKPWPPMLSVSPLLTPVLGPLLSETTWGHCAMKGFCTCLSKEPWQMQMHIFLEHWSSFRKVLSVDETRSSKISKIHLKPTKQRHLQRLPPSTLGSIYCWTSRCSKTPAFSAAASQTPNLSWNLPPKKKLAMTSALT